MSGIKRFLEDVAEELGIEDIMDPRVRARAHHLMGLKHHRLPCEGEARFWMAYTVRTDGSVSVAAKTYDVGHSMKCKWTAFLNDLGAGTPGTWRVVEDSPVRKAVEYTDRYIKMTVFQLVTVNVLTDVPEVGQSGEYKSVGQCVHDGTHLTDCDDDGFCNYCGEQEPAITERQDLPDNDDVI